MRYPQENVTRVGVFHKIYRKTTGRSAGFLNRPVFTFISRLIKMRVQPVVGTEQVSISTAPGISGYNSLIPMLFINDYLLIINLEVIWLIMNISQHRFIYSFVYACLVVILPSGIRVLVKRMTINYRKHKKLSNAY